MLVDASGDEAVGRLLAAGRGSSFGPLALSLDDDSARALVEEVL